MIDLVQALAETWHSIDDLGSSLSEEEWKRPTGCPGWTVQDHLSHLIDYESFALGLPRPDHTVGVAEHVRNDMGRTNEVGVDARRSCTGAAVLGEFRDVTRQRLTSLRGVTEADLDEKAITPIGAGTVRDLLTLRVMDTWSHEQDMRRALDRPGHAQGLAPDITIEYLSRFLGFAVAKKAGVADATIVFAIGDTAPIAVEVHDGRGAPVDPPEQPTVTLRLDASTFAALCGGRADAPAARVQIEGNAALGEQVIANLGFMP